MKGNAILVTSEPKGVYVHGIISGTPKPGVCMEVTSTADVAGAHTFQVYQPGTDGNRRLVIVLLENYLLGGVADGTFENGASAMLYCPLPGEELNMLYKDVTGTGTGSDITKGDLLIIDTGSGKLVHSSPQSPEAEPFQALETKADLTADYLTHCWFTGC